MAEFWHLNLIRLFAFYLAAVFLLGTMRRLRQYRDILQLVAAVPGRWPKVFDMIKRHRIMFLTWTTLRPAAVALLLCLVHTVACRLIWPRAHLTPADLVNEWWMLLFVLPALGAMLFVDLLGVIRVGRFDLPETEKYLDEAEHWLTSWKAPLVRVVTLGWINPRQMVEVEVRKALEAGHDLISSTLWWISVQAALRVVFGLTLWTAWAVHPAPAEAPQAAAVAPEAPPPAGGE